MICNGREIIRAGYAASMPVSEIARQAGSTPGSVRVIAHKMGIRHGSFISERIPAEHQDDYRHLLRRKHFHAAAALRVLGLEAQP